MHLRAGVASDRGLVRPSNEDSFFLRRGLYAVCDGMGGARAGEVASQMACLGLLALNPAAAEQQDLRAAIVNANQAIVDRSAADEHLLGMGTTLTTVLVRPGSLILGHVGDSRAYLLHDDSLTQMSEDHSWVGEMVRRGELTPAQAAVHPNRSVITRALGTEGDIDPDVIEVDIGEGDRVLLCSDGLTGMVSDDEIAELLRRHEDPQAAADSLVQAALARGGEDNVTVVVVDIMARDDEEGSGSGSHGPFEDRILIGPSERGEAAADSPHRSRRAGAAVRERLGRRTTPAVRPVGPKQAKGDLPGEDAPPAQAAAAAEAPPAAETPPASETETPPGAEPAPAVKRSRRWRSRRRWVFLIIAIVSVIVIAIAAFAVVNSTVYYVGTYGDGTVALYKGLPASPIGVDLSYVVEMSTVKYETLGPHLQSVVNTHDLVSKEEGQLFLRTLGMEQ